MATDEMVTIEELAQFMEGRESFYRFAGSALLHEFTVEQIEEMKTSGFFDLEEFADTDAAESLAKAKRYLARPGADPRTDLAVDYARIFLSAGVYEGLTAEPYESVFTSDDHILMQDARDSAVRIYRENGVDVDSSLHMPEDHLGLELEFLAIMAQRTAQALRSADGLQDPSSDDVEFAEIVRMVHVQADFLSEHVLNWIDDLTEKVDEYAKYPLYPALMRLIKVYAIQDIDVLVEVAGALG